MLVFCPELSIVYEIMHLLESLYVSSQWQVHDIGQTKELMG